VENVGEKERRREERGEGREKKGEGRQETRERREERGERREETGDRRQEKGERRDAYQPLLENWGSTHCRQVECEPSRWRSRTGPSAERHSAPDPSGPWAEHINPQPAERLRY
jgi:hypothetical protein